MFRSLCLSFIATFALAAAAQAAPEVGKAAPDFTATDYAGKSVKLSDFKGKVVVLEWTNPGCPFVKKHYTSGNMQSLQKDLTGKGVIWLTVNSSAPGKQGYMDAAKAKEEFAKAPPLGTHYLLDSTGTIGKLYDAKTTPHMFVVNKEGTLVYAGAIDDKATVDIADIAGAKNYVMAATTELLAGKAVTTASTQAYGCAVKYAD